MRRLKEALNSRNREGEEMQSRINQMSQKIQELSIVERKNQDYENKVVMATQEIERLNRILRERNAELGESREKNR